MGDMEGFRRIGREAGRGAEMASRKGHRDDGEGSRKLNKRQVAQNEGAILGRRSQGPAIKSINSLNDRP